MIGRLGLTALFCTALLGACAGNFARAEPSASLPVSTLKTARGLVIQHGGRHKPFDSFARETLRTITGASTWQSEDPVGTVLSIVAEPERWQDAPLIQVPFVPLREPLGLDHKTAAVSYNSLVATRKLMRMLPSIVEKQARDEKLSMLENETMDLFQRFVAFSALLEQRLELIPPPQGRRSWLPVLQPEGYPVDQQQAFRASWTALLAAVRARDATAVETASRQLGNMLESANPNAYPPLWRRRLEVHYNQFQPFRAARWAYFLAFLVLAMGLRKPRLGATKTGLVVFVAGAFLHGGGILARVVLGGRPPVSNFFETMLWLPFVAVVLALVFERVYRGEVFVMAAALLAVITLTLADYVPLDASITPVVAVLRSNKWLTIHVLTIVASYGALALATTLAHIYGWVYVVGSSGKAARASREARQTLAGLDTFLYRTIQVGVVLLAGGIMLGAVWANASWGRYWGWDPKETWALITLLWFLAILHGRFAGWIRGVGVALCTIGGFLLLLMTYYGVSFYLVGLHSYAGGHAKPLPPLLIAYLIGEAAFLLLVGLSVTRRRAA